MVDAGERLKRERERLNLTIRDVEEASRIISGRHGIDDFTVGASRLSEIENKGAVPAVYRLYSLAVIYRLDLSELLEWYGLDVSSQAADAAAIQVSRTHLIRFRQDTRGYAPYPLALDPGIDVRKTTYLSRMIQRWGRLPLSLLSGMDLKNHRYGYVGADDWTMHPIITPGSLVLIDETRRKIVKSGWRSEYERPVYFLEHRQGYAVGWCSLAGDQLILQPHPASECVPQLFRFEKEIDVIGQVTGVAMRLDPARQRRSRSSAARAEPPRR